MNGDIEQLARARRRFVVPALAVFSVWFGGFLVCLGYARGFMATAVVGSFTWAYLWALSLIVLTWALAWAYLRWAERTLGPLVERARR